MCYFLYVFRRIKYYFKADISFERQVSDMDEVQRTTAQFHVPPMSSANAPLNICNITTSLLNSIDDFTSHGSGCVISQIQLNSTVTLKLNWRSKNSLSQSWYSNVQARQFLTVPWAQSICYFWNIKITIMMWHHVSTFSYFHSECIWNKSLMNVQFI